ncbi:hypothetical protein BC938DRAFT_480697 [Jimgerdemannia flammicorona]|uniref:Uncharacterized protein n=1 Tax=Jimgerdemannia flammicorona TaxID=994334 RepID=A0A433R0I0_9FUNG|nr:hypothetical protein BC938DRAFT_480697 [Jimgerdemannia flammicorona]
MPTPASVSFSKLFEHYEYFIERQPNEWREVDFLSWLNEKRDVLFKKNMLIEDRMGQWHYIFKKLLDSVKYRSKSLLEFPQQVTEDIDVDDLITFADTALKSANALYKNTKIIPKDISEWWIAAVIRNERSSKAPEILLNTKDTFAQEEPTSTRIGLRRKRVTTYRQEANGESSKPIEESDIDEDNEDKADEDDGDEEEAQSESDFVECMDDDEAESSPTQLEFSNCYKAMMPGKKWMLSSGTCVEDVVYTHCCSSKPDSALHSWIIDVDDIVTRDLFSATDWAEINRELKHLPRVAEKFATYLSKFETVTTTKQLRETLAATSVQGDEEYNREIHCDEEWAEYVLRKSLTDYEDPSNPLEKYHHKGWYDVNIWGALIDHGFQNNTGLEVVRKESTTTATTTRKNRKRTSTKGNRAKMGYRVDGIFRTYVNEVEYGAIKVSKDFKGVTATKWLDDARKLAKAMHDILVQLCHVVRFEEPKVRELQVVGILHGGLKLQSMRMNSPKGYISIMKRDDLNEVPIVVGRLADLIFVLKRVWQVKEIVRECMSVVNSPTSQTEQEMLEEILDEGNRTPQRIVLPWSFDTPN